jgi:hypothetical protein
MAKKYDIVAKVGEKDGKAQWKNVGAVMTGDKGPYIILDRSFNPAGLPNPDDRSNILLSLFEPKQQGQQGGSQEWDQDQSGDIPF